MEREFLVSGGRSGRINSTTKDSNFTCSSLSHKDEHGFLSEDFPSIIVSIGEVNRADQITHKDEALNTHKDENLGEFSSTALTARNGADVVVLLESIQVASERKTQGKYGLVKLHGVPVTAFSKDGLSAISMKLGTPLMLDFYTSNMCIQSWGRSSYTKALIDIRVDVELKDTIMVVMPKLVEEGFDTYTYSY
ncbi:hypothetical protein Tco_0949551 [Tanacetum coccineum]